MWKNDTFDFSVSLFGSDVHDFIMLERVGKDVSARNIKATRLGGEIEGKWKFARQLGKSGSSLAYTYGKNRTDDRPLAQTPPLEWKNSLTWDNETLSAGVLWRVVSAQNAMQRDKATLLGRTLVLQQALEHYPLIQGGKLINMPLCRAELITYLINPMQNL